MSIRYKYLLLFPLMALLPVLVFYFFTNHYISNGLMKIQLSRLDRDILAVRLQFAASGNQMRSLAQAYARWDEIYEILPYATHESISAEIMPLMSEDFTKLRVAVIDDKDRVVLSSGGIASEDALNVLNKLRNQYSAFDSGYSFEQLSGELTIASFSRFTREDVTSVPRGYLLLIKSIEQLKPNLEASVESPFTVYIGRTTAVAGNGGASPEGMSYALWRNLYTRFIEGEETVSLSDKSSFFTTVYAPLRGASGIVVGILQVTSSDEDLLPVKVNLDRTTIIIFAVVALLSVMVAFVSSYYLSNRITKLSEATRNILSGDSLQTNKNPLIFRDELDELLSNFMRMKRELDDYFQQLLASEVKYRRVVNTSITGLFVYCDGKYQFCNTRFEEITGYTLDELNMFDPLNYIHVADRDKFVENIVMRLGSDPLRQPIDTRIITKNGTERVVNIRAENIDYQNEPALLGHVSDVTEQREMEKRVFQSQKLEAIGTLAGGVAHDFNNVIGGIIGFAEMLAERYSEDKKVIEITDRIVKLGRRGSRLVKNLLAFARGESAYKEILDIEDAINRSLDLFVLPRHMNINVRCEFSGEKPSVLFSPVQFEQMLINLLVNARDALPEGGNITLSTDIVKATQSGTVVELVEIRVADDGLGIPKEYIGRIFDPFFTTKEVGKGTGLGLAVVYGIVEDHSGTISALSNPDKGTEFVLHFPLVRLPDAESDVDPTTHTGMQTDVDE